MDYDLWKTTDPELEALAAKEDWIESQINDRPLSEWALKLNMYDWGIYDKGDVYQAAWDYLEKKYAGMKSCWKL